MDHTQGERLEKNDLSAWADLIRFKPSKEILERADKRYLKVQLQRIEHGWGDINLDYYPVHVSLLPYKPWSTERLTADELLEYFRLHLSGDTFVDPDKAEFSTYDDPDVPIWQSRNAESAVIHININPDDGSVICSQHGDQTFRFSTVTTVDDGVHPVSGNREFGYWVRPAPNSKAPVVNQVTRIQLPQYVFYTRGADRLSDDINWIVQGVSGRVFAGGHALWRDMQQRFLTFVNDNLGVATASFNISKRHGWKMIQRDYLSAGEALGGAMKAVGAAVRALQAAGH